MTQDSNPQDEFDSRLTRALEISPAYTISPGFAARTAALAQAHLSAHPLSAPSPSFSRLSIHFGFALLVLAMVLLPAFAGVHSPLFIRSEALFALELAALTTWLSLRRNSSA